MILVSESKRSCVARDLPLGSWVGTFSQLRPWSSGTGGAWGWGRILGQGQEAVGGVPWLSPPPGAHLCPPLTALVMPVSLLAHRYLQV